MNIIGQFDPTSITPGTDGGLFVASSSSGNGKLVAYNESNIGLSLQFPNGYTKYLAAWTADIICVGGFSLQIVWKQIATLASNNPPLSYVLFESYDTGEPVPGTFPCALSRQSNVGNVISSVGGATNSIVNDGNAAGIQIIEATVLVEGLSSVILTNDAQMTLGNSTHPGLLTINNSLGAAGQLTVDNTGKLNVHRSIGANLLTAFASNDLALKVNSGQRIAFDVNNVDIAEVNANGITIDSGGLLFPNGQRITAISWFGPYTSTTSSTSYAHNLGVTPTVILTQENGGVSAIRRVNIDFATLTSSNFTGTANAAGFLFYGVALKFA